MRKLLIIALSVIACNTARAEVKLPKIFGDNMVLQQQGRVNLWGTATGREVKVSTGWDNKVYLTKPDKDGRWMLTVATPEADGVAHTLTFDDGDKLVFQNVLLGEVWICSGQSNMEMPMKGFKNQPIEGASMDILRAKNSNIRLFTVKRHSSFAPTEDVSGAWNEARAETVRDFSATAYYFGQVIEAQLEVPVGLIVTAWGGSACEAWMHSDWLRAFPDAKLPQSEEDIKSKNRTPTALYNGMLKPLIGYTMRGVIWYQGEDNCNRYQTYADMFTALIAGWRKDWKQGDFPFYYCQIAPYDYAIVTEKGKEPDNSAYLREQQAKAEFMSENVGMAVLMDAGLEKCIHPMKKREVGERLARMALAKTYGAKGFTSQSPYYSSMEIKGDAIELTFERAPMWLNCGGVFESENFTIAGEDRVFHKAQASIERDKVRVKSEQVPNPVAVRYGFQNFVQGDLFGEDLPVSSFRTDSW